MGLALSERRTRPGFCLGRSLSVVELDWNQNWGGMATKQLGQLARMANRRRDQLDERTSRLSRHEMTQVR